MQGAALPEQRICKFSVRPVRRNGEDISISIGLIGDRVCSAEIAITFGKSKQPVNPNQSDFRHVIEVIAKELDGEGRMKITDPETKKGTLISGQAILEILRENIHELRQGKVYGPIAVLPEM